MTSTTTDEPTTAEREGSEHPEQVRLVVTVVLTDRGAALYDPHDPEKRPMVPRCSPEAVRAQTLENFEGFDFDVRPTPGKDLDEDWGYYDVHVESAVLAEDQHIETPEEDA